MHVYKKLVGLLGKGALVRRKRPRRLAELKVLLLLSTVYTTPRYPEEGQLT